MADTSAEADIRGINIDKLAKGFADELNVFKKFVNVTTTSARELRWYSKTAGFLDSVDTTTITISQIANTSFKARPVVVEQSWTRNTSYVRKYMVESPWISDEDIKDNDVDILATNVRDLVRAVERQVDARIYAGLIAAGCGTSVATADGWDDAVTGDPIKDILTMKTGLRTYGYKPEGAILVMGAAEHTHLLAYLINIKGASIPAFSSSLVGKGVIQEILGVGVVVSENCTAATATLISKEAATWKSFTPITAVKIIEPLIGTKIRVAEEGEIIRHDPYAVYHLTVV